MSFGQESRLFLRNGKEFQFDELVIPELKKMKSSVYHPQGNSFLECKHLEIAKLCGIYDLLPHELSDLILNAASKHPSLQVHNLAVRYVPKSQRNKKDDIWRFVENKGRRNEKSTSIIAKDLETGKISYLHKDDYKVTIRTICDFLENQSSIFEFNFRI